MRSLVRVPQFSLIHLLPFVERKRVFSGQLLESDYSTPLCGARVNPWRAIPLLPFMEPRQVFFGELLESRYMLFLPGRSGSFAASDSHGSETILP